MAESIFSNIYTPLNQQEEEEEEKYPVLPTKDTDVPSIFSYPPTSTKPKEETIPSPLTSITSPAPPTYKKYSQTELYANPEFQQVAERFMDSINANEDVFEYMRDADWRLGSTIMRAAQIGNWDDQTKKDYVYLRNAFNNTDLKGVKEWLQFSKDVGIDVLTDPLNYAALFFAAPTLGGSFALKASAQEAAKAGLKQITKKQLSKGTVKDLAKNLPKDLKRQVMLDGAKRTGVVEAVHGGSWLGLHDYFTQTSDIGLGVQHSGEVDWGQVGLSTALGAGFGGLFGAVTGGFSARKYLIREFNASNEMAITKEAARVQRAAKVDKEIIPKLKENEKLGIGSISKLIAHTVGKPTTRFKNLAKGSPKLQEFLSKFRHDWDYTTASKQAKQVREDSFGASLVRWSSKLLRDIDVSTNSLKRQSSWWKFVTDRENAKLNHLTAEDNNQLWHLIVNPQRKKVDDQAVKPEIRQAANDIRKVLREIFQEGQKAGVWKNWEKVDNYLPRKWQYAIVEKDRDILEKILIKHKYADPIDEYKPVKAVTAAGQRTNVILEHQGTIDQEAFPKFFKEYGGKSFREVAGGDEQLAKEMKAGAIVDSMLDSRFTPFELRFREKGGYGFLQTRPFYLIPDEEIKGFLETDVEKILKDYITNASTVIKRTEFFGKTGEDLSKKWLNPIKLELLSHKDSKGNRLLTTTEASKIVKDLANMHNKVTGVDTQVIETGWIRTSVEAAKLIQQMAHLPLATISSLTEPMIMLTRVGWRDGPLVTKEVFRSLAKETVRSVDRTTRAIGRGVGLKIKGRGRDLTNDEWLELYENGLALEQAVMDRIEGMHGTNFQNTITRSAQNIFFKSNLLTQWTSAVQLASFTVGKNLIRKNTEKLYKNAKGIKYIEPKKKAFLEEQLIDLGINPNEAMSWYGRHYKNGKFNATGKGGAFSKTFYQDKIGAAANRFTNEIILNPSGLQANKPLWYSNPSANFLVQFLGYPTVFNNTILKRFLNDSWRHKARVAPKVAATTMLMTATALATNYIRTVGIQRNEKFYNEQSDWQHLKDAWSRWGGFFWADYGIRYAEARERGGKALPAFGRLFGPIGQDLVEMFQYNRGILETISRNVPYSAWIPTEVKREMYKRARELEGRLEVIEEEPYIQKKGSSRRTPRGGDRRKPRKE